MRPQVGGELQPPRPRKRSSADLGPAAGAVATPGPGGAAPTSLMMGTERDVDAFITEPVTIGEGNNTESSGNVSGTSSASSDSTYGVRSITDETELPTQMPTDGPDSKEKVLGEQEGPASPSRRRSTMRTSQVRRDESSSDLSAMSEFTSEASSPGKSMTKNLRRQHSDLQLSAPLTPLSRASPYPGSEAPGSPGSISARSLHPSDDESEAGSQAILSSGDEDMQEDADQARQEPNSSGLQLVMPSLMMPSRRPFTNRGKQLGKLKILFAGAGGVGKSSLIKSIVQVCEDIVHVDPQPPATPQIMARKPNAKKSSPRPTKQVIEIHASTKPYPEWWSQIEESQVLRRRRSGGEEVLERNVCFVDTPGYGKGSSFLESTETVLQYIEAQMHRAMPTTAMQDSEMVNVLGGAGGAQVDVVLYLLSPDLKPVDLEFIRQLSTFTNLIPILPKFDIRTEKEEDVRLKVQKQLQAADISWTKLLHDNKTGIYNVCSLPLNDLENMDASLLMSSDFIQPLQPSDLPKLVSSLFDPSTATFLKYSAARKIVEWRHCNSPGAFAPTHNPLQSNFFAPTLPLSPTSHALALTRSPSSPTTAALSYTSARLMDHKHREERLAQVHMGTWAHTLRASLAAERARFEALANADREAWLLQRLRECVYDGKILRGEDVLAMNGMPRRAHRTCLDTEQHLRRIHARRPGWGGVEDLLDPLALMRWRQRALTALQIMGGVSLLGAVAFWVAKAWELEWGWFEEMGLSRLLGAVQGGFGVGITGHPRGGLGTDW